MQGQEPEEQDEGPERDWKEEPNTGSRREEVLVVLVEEEPGGERRGGGSWLTLRQR